MAIMSRTAIGATLAASVFTLAFGMSGCSLSPSTDPVSLDGEWKQTNSGSTDSWQAATITGDTIEIDWVAGNGDTRSIYWVGDVAVPADAGRTFTWSSTRDQEKTDSALLASTADTKDFTYDNGEISYSASILGTTSTIRLERE